MLSHHQFQTAADRFGLGKVMEAESAKGGVFGQNVLLTTSLGRYVLRGNPYTPWQFEHEAYFARWLDAHTDVPAPWPYHVETSTELFGWPYAIMRRLDGDPPEALWADLTADQRREIARAMGEALARLQVLTGPGFGTWDPTTRAVETTEHFADSWLARIRELVAEGREIGGALDPADLDWIAEQIEVNRSGLEIVPEPCFVHSDYNTGNVCVVAEPWWTVSGIFDLRRARFGDGEEDLVRLIGMFAMHTRDCIEPFVRAYRERRPLRPGYQERFRLYMLRDRLFLWNYGRRNGLWFSEDIRFRSYAGFFITQDPFLD